MTMEAKTTGNLEVSAPGVAQQIFTTDPSGESLLREPKPRGTLINRNIPASESTAPTILPQLVDNPMDITMSSWPWIGSGAWDEASSDMTWDGLDFSRSDVDELLTNANAFASDASGAGELNTFSPVQPPSVPSSPNFRTLHFGKPGPGSHERHDARSGNNIQKSVGAGSINSLSDQSPSVVIAQLSQLSVELSALRASSHTLAQASDFSFGRGSHEGHSPLIDSAAFDSVVAWLPPEKSPAPLDPRCSSQISADIPNFMPNSTCLMGTLNGPGILRDVFSASHRLMEIIQNLQADDITRHLIRACEALLLETYAAVLTALQHEAYPGDTVSATALGNVRLVLVVQLCSYLIERQHQAVGHCLIPATVQKHNLPGLMQSGNPETECLKDLKAQVQQKLARLRQMLRCS